MNSYHYIISWISWSIVELWYRCWCNVVVELSYNNIWPSSLKQFKLHSLSAIWSESLILWKAHRTHTAFLWTLTFVFDVQLIWPLLRCLGNLLVSGGDVMPEDTRLLAALCVFSQTYLHLHPALSRESLWALNNLTGEQDVSMHLLKMISISINSAVKLKLKWTCVLLEKTNFSQLWPRFVQFDLFFSRFKWVLLWPAAPQHGSHINPISVFFERN